MIKKKFFVHSTYDLEGTEGRARKADLCRKIIQAYDSPLIRWYCRIRFHIINIDFLDTLEQHLTNNAKVLDIGCGFGLFALYYALNAPQRLITGFDLSKPRVDEANLVANKLGVQNVEFFCQDAQSYEFLQDFDVVVTLDLLHHVSSETAEKLIGQAYQALTPRGILIIKDVNTRPLHKLYFTYILDKLMMPRSSVHYRSTWAWKAALTKAGFEQVISYPLNDYLPYPHVLIIAHKHGPMA